METQTIAALVTGSHTGDTATCNKTMDRPAADAQLDRPAYGGNSVRYNSRARLGGLSRSHSTTCRGSRGGQGLTRHRHRRAAAGSRQPETFRRRRPFINRDGIGCSGRPRNNMAITANRFLHLIKALRETAPRVRRHARHADPTGNKSPKGGRKTLARLRLCVVGSRPLHFPFAAPYVVAFGEVMPKPMPYAWNQIIPSLRA